MSDKTNNQEGPKTPPVVQKKASPPVYELIERDAYIRFKGVNYSLNGKEVIRDGKAIAIVPSASILRQLHLAGGSYAKHVKVTQAK